jgi:hypothetical protein
VGYNKSVESQEVGRARKPSSCGAVTVWNRLRLSTEVLKLTRPEQGVDGTPLIRAAIALDIRQ